MNIYPTLSDQPLALLILHQSDYNLYVVRNIMLKHHYPEKGQGDTDSKQLAWNFPGLQESLPGRGPLSQKSILSV